jgi:ATP phosphoribosyltransferase regulatory subunit
VLRAKDEADAEALVGLFESSGYPRIEPAILQPIEPFLDLSGEDIRRRMFVTSDGHGREWCLRPEYTIPVSLAYLARHEAGRAANYSYLGPVFRQRTGEVGEFKQAGVESFGRGDREAADAEIFAIAVTGVVEAGFSALDVRIGDVGLFAALVEQLSLPSAVARRLRRAFARGGLDAETIATAGETGQGHDGHPGVLAALQGQDPAEARAFVEDILKIAGISSVGGRSAADIAGRFLEKAAEKDAALGQEQAGILSRFAQVQGDPDEAAQALRDLAEAAGLDLSAEIDRLETRTGFLAAAGADVSSFRFSAAMGRNLDYYTGFVFEIGDERRPGSKPIVGGGRYDGLLAMLGAGTEVPAVGASIWLDRLAEATS